MRTGLHKCDIMHNHFFVIQTLPSWSQTTSVRSDQSELVCVLVSMATTLANELVGRLRPYHMKAGYMKSANQMF